jgi:hypothetical protein
MSLYNVNVSTQNLGSVYFSHNDNAFQVLTTALHCIKTYNTYTLAGLKPGIFFSEGGRDDHYVTPPGHTT